MIGLDRDEESLEIAQNHLAPFAGARLILRQGSYDNLADTLKELGRPQVAGVLLDLGFSSTQVDAADRGFSFQREGPLDMRMDRSSGQTAEEFLAQSSERELARILFEYGEERDSRRIARVLVSEGRRSPLRTTTQLASLLSSIMSRRGGRVHPATRVFQALRIAVNRELERLDRFLREFLDCLVPQGRAAVIAYHSLEDRRVKQSFRAAVQEGRARFVTRRPIRPAEQEVRDNPRARSARLRVLERI